MFALFFFPLQLIFCIIGEVKSAGVEVHVCPSVPIEDMMCPFTCIRHLQCNLVTNSSRAFASTY